MTDITKDWWENFEEVTFVEIKTPDDLDEMIPWSELRKLAMPFRDTFLEKFIRPIQKYLPPTKDQWQISYENYDLRKLFYDSATMAQTLILASLVTDDEMADLFIWGCMMQTFSNIYIAERHYEGMNIRFFHMIPYTLQEKWTERFVNQKWELRMTSPFRDISMRYIDWNHIDGSLSEIIQMGMQKVTNDMLYDAPYILCSLKYNYVPEPRRNPYAYSL